MSGNLNDAGVFLITTLFNMYIFILVIRLLLALARTNYFHPTTQFIIKLTQPVVAPLRRVLPNYKGFELSTFILIITLQIIKFLIINLISVGLPDIVGLLLIALIHTVDMILNIYFFAILIQVILSWIQPARSEMVSLLSQLTAPIMRPLYRIIPPIQGIDLAPLAALILLQVLMILMRP